MPFRTVSSQKEYTERLTLLKASVNFNLEIFHRPVSRHAHLVPIRLDPHLHTLTLVRVHPLISSRSSKGHVASKPLLQQGSPNMSHLRVVICGCCKRKTSLKQE